MPSDAEATAWLAELDAAEEASRKDAKAQRRGRSDRRE
jgi:hypothetical protein